MKIRAACPDARVVTVKQWHEQMAGLDELVRPVVLRVNDRRGLVTVRPKTETEITEIKKQRGLPLTDEELVANAGSLVRNPVKLELEGK